MLVLSQDLENWTRDLNKALQTANGQRSFMDCLVMATRQQADEDFRRTLNAVADVVALGHRFSGALALFPQVFPMDYVTIVRYGEIYGELDLVLRRLVEYPEDMAPRCQR